LELSDPILLHIESATEPCSVAISRGEQVVAYVKSIKKFDHATRMLLMIEQCLQQAGLSKSDLTALAVSMGPGSYTGLRVALSTAKGLCLALDIPLIGLSTLEIIVRGARLEVGEEPHTYIPMVDARRDEVYCGIYNDQGEEVTAEAPFILSPESIHKLEQAHGKIVFCGNGSAKIHQFATPTASMKIIANDPSAAKMSTPALAKWNQKEFLNLFSASPTYLKSPNITQAKPRIIH